MPDADFMPAMRPGDLAAGLRQTGDAVESWMTSAQNRRLAQQQADQRQTIFDIEQPVREAAARADLMKAAVDIDAAKAMQDQRMTAYTLKPNADRAFDAILSETNPDVREGLAHDWIGAYGQLGSVAEFKTEMDTKKALLGDMLKENAAMRELKAKQAGAQDIQDAKSESAAEVAKIRADLQSQLDKERTDRANDAIKARQDLQNARFEAAGGVEQQKAINSNIAKQVMSVIDSTQKNYDTLNQTRRARALLDAGAEQGRGENMVLETEKAINTFLPGLFDTANRESLKNSYSEMALSAAAKMRGQGQITQPERQLLADTVAQFGNTPEAARYIMDFMDAVANREIARADYFGEINGSGKAITLQDMNDFFKKNPLDKFLKSAAPGSPKTNPEIDNLLKKYPARK